MFRRSWLCDCRMLTMLFTDASIFARWSGVAWTRSSASATCFEIICFVMNRRPGPCAHAVPAAIRSASAPTPIRIFFVIVFLLGDGVRRALCSSVAAMFRSVAVPSLQVLTRPQGLLDARARVAHHELRRLAGKRRHQIHILAGELDADVVGDLRQRALALVIALADQPLPEELLVEHLLVLAAEEPLLAAFRDPVAAGVRRVDLVDDPQLAFGVDAELVLGVHQDQTALLRPRLPRREQVEREAGHLVPLLLRDRSAADQLLRRDGLVVLADLLLGARSQDGPLELLVLAHFPRELDAVGFRAVSRLVVAPEGPGEVAAHHHLHRQRLQPPHH